MYHIGYLPHRWNTPRRGQRWRVGREPGKSQGARASATCGVTDDSADVYLGQVMSNAPRFLYVTVSSRQEGVEIARQLVRERLAACGNLFGPTTSIYEWKGVLEENEEMVLLLKTRAELVQRAMERVVELHSYECPCVAELSLGTVHPAFAQWIGEQTSLD